MRIVSRALFVSCLALACLSVPRASTAAADDYESLVRRYTEIQKAVSRSRGESNSAAKQAAPIVREIAALRTERARRFLVKEATRPPASLGRVCARALAGSGDSRAAALLLENFGRHRPGTARVVIDALEWAAERGENGRGRSGQRAPGREAPDEGKRARKNARAKESPKGVEPLDLRTVEAELLEAARDVARTDLKARMVVLIGRLESVAAASAIVRLSEGDADGGGQRDELRSAAVLALTAMGEESDEVRRWLESTAFDGAREDAGQLIVLAETVGRLELRGARRRLERLIGHPSRTVGVGALEALSRVEKDIPSRALAIGYGWLQRERDSVLRARILDSLARGGERGVKLVLRVANATDAETRAIALGSLALVLDRPAALERVLEGLRDPARDVRSVALRAVRGVRTKEFISQLIDLLGRETEERLRVDGLKLLVGLTGHNMGLVAADWKKWWRFEEETFEFPEERETGSTAVKTQDVSYFGIEISSRKMAFLLDVSNSMLPYARSKNSGPGKMRKIDLLKRELTGVLEKLPPETLVNVHVFDRDVRSWEKRLQLLRGGGRERAVEYVGGLGTAGGTNIFDSIEIAMRDPAIDTIYLLTDGQPTTGRYSTPPGILKGVRDLNRARAVTFHCIAFGGQSDLLRELAAEHGGEYRFVNE